MSWLFLNIKVNIFSTNEFVGNAKYKCETSNMEITDLLAETVLMEA